MRPPTKMKDFDGYFGPCCPIYLRVRSSHSGAMLAYLRAMLVPCWPHHGVKVGHFEATFTPYVWFAPTLFFWSLVFRLVQNLQHQHLTRRSRPVGASPKNIKPFLGNGALCRDRSYKAVYELETNPWGKVGRLHSKEPMPGQTYSTCKEASWEVRWTTGNKPNILRPSAGRSPMRLGNKVIKSPQGNTCTCKNVQKDKLGAYQRHPGPQTQAGKRKAKM